MTKTRGTSSSWKVFSVALFSLLALMLVPGLRALRRSQTIYHDVRQMQETYDRSQRILESVTGKVFLTSILVREFLLDSSATAGDAYRDRLGGVRAELNAEIAELRGLMRPAEVGAIERLRQEVEGYQRSIDPILRWTPAERRLRATYFLREEQRPTRRSVLAVATEVEQINMALYRQQSDRVNESERQYRDDLQRTLWVAMLAGLAIAGASIARIAVLEHRARLQHAQAERTGLEMRHLSARLRQAQEDERKTISRELHDEVGQKLTALRMGLGGVERMRAAGEEHYRGHLDEMKALAEQSMKIIRDIAAGLRPSLLDDLGLGPALQRQVREFSRHTGIPVHIDIAGELDGLAERQRTCIYRVVQESLTNCAKHAHASRIDVGLAGSAEAVELTVADDGAGFRVRTEEGAGLGLIGIEERVRELEGELRIESEPGKGTRLRVRLPRNGKTT